MSKDEDSRQGSKGAKGKDKSIVQRLKDTITQGKDGAGRKDKSIEAVLSEKIKA